MNDVCDSSDCSVGGGGGGDLGLQDDTFQYGGGGGGVQWYRVQCGLIWWCL